MNDLSARVNRAPEGHMLMPYTRLNNCGMLQHFFANIPEIQTFIDYFEASADVTNFLFRKLWQTVLISC